jgi:hypothetical protein|tara:strand:- start:541 stop:816 length:276 start_codon:yes stop_codon:yes gene_type:complete
MSDRNKLEDFQIILTVRVPEQSVEYVYNSIVDGMEFDEETGEGILHYAVQKVETVTNGDDSVTGIMNYIKDSIAGIMNYIKGLSDQIKGGE